MQLKTGGVAQGKWVSVPAIGAPYIVTIGFDMTQGDVEAYQLELETEIENHIIFGEHVIAPDYANLIITSTESVMDYSYSKVI